jgi:hypothetical protein
MLIYDKFGYNRIQARLIHEIIKDENNLYNQIEHELHFMKGAGSDAVKEKRKFVYRGHKIIFDKIDFGDQIHYSLNTLDQKEECLVIIISKNEKEEMCADIHQISMKKTCPVVGKLISGGGSLLLEIAIDFIKSIQEKYDIKIIKIKDNSVKTCKNKQIKLWLLNTLRDGAPWHIKHNFKPYNSEKLEINEANNIKIIANYKILTITKTSILKEKKIIDVDIDDKIKAIYNKYENESIMKFFKKLLKKSDNCIYLEGKEKNIIDNLLLFDVSGISYFIDLKKPPFE